MCFVFDIAPHCSWNNLVIRVTPCILLYIGSARVTPCADIVLDVMLAFAESLFTCSIYRCDAPRDLELQVQPKPLFSLSGADVANMFLTLCWSFQNRYGSNVWPSWMTFR